VDTIEGILFINVTYTYSMMLLFVINHVMNIDKTNNYYYYILFSKLYMTCYIKAIFFLLIIIF